MPVFKSDKLRVNLRLCINRLKLLEKKKTEQALKARKEIADYMKAGRLERARIRVEHIIREDYLVEAMEVIELYCDLLLARFGMLEQMKFCEDGIIESVSTLIWVAPRLSAELQELSVVEKQLEIKFGREFAQHARSNITGTVNPKVIHRLGIEAPKKSLVENYMIEIARNYKVEYEPDPSALMDEDDLPIGPPPDDKPFFPGDFGGGGGGGKEEAVPTGPPAFPPIPQAPYSTGPLVPQAGPLPQKFPVDDFRIPAPPYTERDNTANVPLPYPSGPLPGQQPPQLPQPPRMPQPNTHDDGLNLPPVPTTGFPDSSMNSDDGGGGGGGDVDFDDLTRRFEDLKKRR